MIKTNQTMASSYDILVVKLTTHHISLFLPWQHSRSHQKLRETNYHNKIIIRPRDWVSRIYIFILLIRNKNKRKQTENSEIHTIKVKNNSSADS